MGEQEFIQGLAGIPAAKSAVSVIDGQKGILSYRGYAIEDLAEKSNFEEVSYLLLFGQLPTRQELEKFDEDLSRSRRLKYKIIEVLKHLPENGHPMDALQAMVPVLGMFYPDKNVNDPQHRYQSAVRLIAVLPTILAVFHRLRRGDHHVLPRPELTHAANFLWMLDEREPEELKARILDACLILHVEHGMNASTFTGRVIGSTLADPYATISGAIGSLSGPLHGGANEQVLEMLDEIGSVENVRPWLDRAVREKRKIMGMGHRVYKVKDPRATILQKMAQRLFEKFGSTSKYDIACELEKQAEGPLGERGIYPNVDFYSGIVYNKLGITPDLFTPIFALSRVSGWLAHWFEQMEDNRIYRPSQIYVGNRDLKYTPIGSRGNGAGPGMALDLDGKPKPSPTDD